MAGNSEGFRESELAFVRKTGSNLNYPPVLRELKCIFDWVRNLRLLVKDVRAGWAEFKKTGATPPTGYTAFIHLFCHTSGISNEIMHFFIKRKRPKYSFHSKKGILGDLRGESLRQICQAIKRDGYYVFPTRISSEFVEALEKKALATPASPDTSTSSPDVLYDSKNIQTVRYLYQNQKTMSLPEVQEIVADPSILAVAQEYLGCAPVIDLVTMARSNAFLKHPSALSAQHYHFDMDRVRWLKFFVYLTDVTPETGPTCFIKGSHRPFGIPRELLRYNYARLPDSYVEEFYSKDRFIEITAPKGTVFCFDSRGLHKGKNLVTGERHILQMEFVDCLFGMDIVPIECSTNSKSLLENSKRYPSFYEIMKINSVG